MKKIFLSSALVLLSFIMACGGSGTGDPDNGPYTVTYDANVADSGTIPDSETLDKGEALQAADGGDIVKAGYYFDGWNTSKDGSGTGVAFGDDFTPAADTVLYARWLKEMELVSGSDPYYVSAYNISFGKKQICNRSSTFFYDDLSWYINLVGGPIEGLPVVVIPKKIYLTNWEEWFPVWDVNPIFANSTTLERVILQDDIYFITGDWSTTDGTYNYSILKGGAFQNSKKLRSVTLPDSILEIDGMCFKDCVSLESLRLPVKLTVLGREFFYGCKSLKSVTLPPKLTTIENYAFCSCESLASITIPSTVTSIGDFVFTYCKSLTSIDLPAGLTSIGDHSLEGCTALTAINVPGGNAHYVSQDGVLLSGDGTTLIKYPALRPGDSYTIPASVTTLAYRSFEQIRLLRSLTIPSTVTTISSQAYSDPDKDTSNPFSLIIEDGLTAIPDRAFSGCSRLSSLRLPATLTSIGNESFVGCMSLSELTLPGGLTAIGDYAFAHCYVLKTVTIPESVTSIGTFAFGAGFVETVYVKAVTPPALGADAFKTKSTSANTLTAIYVPKGTVDAYKAAWSAYADYIKEQE